MHVGVHLAQLGRLADPAAVRASARAAEALGYRSVWVLDKLLASPSPASALENGDGDRGSLPDHSAQILDPLGVLTYVAASTERVRLGTSVLVAPWYSPIVLARALTTLDVLSAGRLTVGLGTGRSADDRRAAGLGSTGSADRLDVTLDALEALWAATAVEFERGSVRADTGRISLKPVQRPRPPILLGGHGRAALDRAARRADGWNPANLPADQLTSMWASVRDLAAHHGRDPDSMSLVVRATINLTRTPAGRSRRVYEGSRDQVVDDLEATRRAGAHEVILGGMGDLTLDATLEAYATVAEALEMQPAGHELQQSKN